ncbi:hypothetical protein WJX72_003159 [[Myrmecia] bisecta]|uniref:Staygreen protein domain-containing protein n=1 Tax=[Myrmecia] bisecta TaxID=41462 RepID=A0AAW1QEM3_9CHLO
MQLRSRQSSNLFACCSGRSRQPDTGAARNSQVPMFGTPVFNPAKLTVQYLAATTPSGPVPPHPRCYTLTHNDLTGELLLAIGQQYNSAQLAGWYVRMVRDEVLAEWRFGPEPCLHIYCHVSGEERWLAPPVLRNYIFKREMPLVLDLINYAERELLAANPQLANAPVVVHLSSHMQELNVVTEWGGVHYQHCWAALTQHHNHKTPHTKLRR